MMKTDTQALYQHYPHLRVIDEIWGTKECRAFVQRLLTDTRGGKRQGFPPDHARTIMSLFLEHDRVFPEFEDAIHDIRWGDDDQRRYGR